MNALKQVVGIDVAKDSLVVAIGTINHQQQATLVATSTFENTSTGATALIKWIARQQKSTGTGDVPLFIVMEATGVYHEKLAVRLYEKGYTVSVVLASKIKHYMISHNSKSKTDRIDAQLIMRFGLERMIEPWKPAEALWSELRSLVREHDSTNDLLTEIGNRLHALQHQATTPKKMIRRLRAQRDFLKKHLKQIELDLNELITGNSDLNETVEFITSIPGVGMLTAVGVLAETNNFEYVESVDQLVSYAGLDPVHHQSGQHAGTTRISSKGNTRLRRRMYMSSMTAIKYNEPMRRVYDRLVASKGVRMIALTAVMRKLLGLIYTLWKKRQRFDPNADDKRRAALAAA